MLVAVLRRPDGLFTLSVERDGVFQAPSGSSELTSVGTYVERIEPVDFGRLHYGVLLEKAVESLRSTDPSPDSLAALLHTLVSSVPDPGAYEQSLAMPRLEEPSAPPQRTAANPRGFRGTKYQPPTAPRPRRRNFLQYLDGANHEAALLQQLTRHLPAAVSLVAQHATYGELLASRKQDALRPLGQCWPADASARLTQLPAKFRRYCLWAVRGMNWESISELVSAYWGLGLDEDPVLRRVASCMLASSPIPTTIRWIRALDGVAPHRRHAFAELVFETQAYRSDANGLADVVRRHEQLCSDDNYRHRTHYLLLGIRESRSSSYILDGFELANEYKPDAEFTHQGDGPPVLANIQTAMASIGDTDEHWPKTGFPLVLWERCGLLEGFGELLGELDWRELGCKHAYQFADLLAGTVYTDVGGEDLAEKWEVVRGHSEKMHRVVCGVPTNYREKATLHLSEIVYVWDDPDELDMMLRRYLDLLPRLCAPPFNEQAVGCEALSSLSCLHDSEWAEVANAPDTALLRLEKDCRRENDSRLISDGLWSLAYKAPKLTARGFASATGRLLTTARTLGCVRARAREALIETIQKTSLFQTDPTSLDACQLATLAEGSAAPAAQTLVSRKLREHIRGETQLTDAQVARARQRILDGWDEVLLSRLDAGAMELVTENLGLPEVPKTAKERHALLFQVSAAEHRRAVRKLLKAHFSGDGDYVANHALNHQWFASHPGIDRELWTRGLELRRDTPDLGGVSISLERDPLEVLRMGTYVGTCLGLGGGQAYSAAAITLDANKQVAYCRNHRGKVIARQILALSEQEKLFCFEIYPLEVPAEIRALFLEFDRAMANALGVTIHDPDAEDDADDSDEIAFLLSREWWFDGAIQVRSAERSESETTD